MPDQETARPSLWDNLKLLFTIILGVGIFGLIGRTLMSESAADRTGYARYQQAKLFCADVDGRDYAGCVQQQQDTLERKAYKEG